MSISYELAKELKEVGFLQEGLGNFGLHTNEITMCIERGENVDEYIRRHNIPYFPTLSELIESCGEKFGGLFLAVVDKNLNAEDSKLGRWGAIGVDTEYRGRGLCPEEAVARLWLTLNKKQDA